MLQKRMRPRKLDVAKMCLLIGNVLLVPSTFVPWFYASSNFANSSESLGVSPFATITRVVFVTHAFDGFVMIGVLYFVLGISTFAVSLRLIRAPRYVRAPTRQYALVGDHVLIMVLAVLGIVFVALSLFVVPYVVVLGSPYYNLSTAYGGWPAIVGLALILAGGILISTTSRSHA